MSNSLAAVHPELVAEWSEKNLPLTPDSITFGSNKKVWWKGACGHEWQTSVKARSNGEKCPICSGARVIAGINDLATLEPLDELFSNLHQIFIFFDHCFTSNGSNVAKSLIPAITLAPEHIGHFSPLERALTLVCHS